MTDIKMYEAMAKLDLPETEREWISCRVEKLIDSFSALDSIDTASSEPLVSVLDIKNILREDIPGKFISREELLSNAPEQYNGYFRVPKTLN